MICYFYLTEEGKSEMTCTRLQNGIECGGKGQLLQRDLGHVETTVLSATCFF